MNVYRVDAFAKPPSSKFDFYPHLESKKADEAFLDRENFQGKPYPKKWRRLELFFDEPLRPRADFYAMTYSHFVCSERAKDLLEDFTGKDCEFLPVAIEGEKETYYICNVTKCGPYVDKANSVMEQLGPIGTMPLLLVSPAFLTDSLAKLTVFKIPEQCMDRIYCVDGFRELVERNRLQGLRFGLAWNGKRGPVPEDTPLGTGWITGDGRKFRLKK